MRILAEALRWMASSSTRGLIAVVSALAVVGPAIAEEPSYYLQFYLAAANPGPLPPLPNPAPPNYPNLSTPPEFPAGRTPVLTSSTRLWIWVNPLNDPGACWTGLDFHIDADGPLSLSGLTLFRPNHFSDAGESIPRWNGVQLPPVSSGGTRYADVILSATVAYGICFPPVGDGYIDGAPRNVLLGYFDVTYAGTGPGSIWLENGATGMYHFSVPPIHDFVQMGFGDAPVPNDMYNTRSALPEAIFIPEPASGVIILLPLLLRARRR